jgi:hypothetical protein
MGARRGQRESITTACSDSTFPSHPEGGEELAEDEGHGRRGYIATVDQEISDLIPSPTQMGVP